MKGYALFLGCTTPTQVLQYELSSRWVCQKLGIKLVDMEDFVCCGINQVNLYQEAGLLLAAMNLAYAEAMDLDILTLCAACS
jgi:heterodisulfide reductase subunit B